MPYTWPVTVAEAKSETDISGTANDAKLQGFVDAATVVVENIVGPVASTAYTEWKDGGGQTIVLDHYPVISVDTVTEYPSGSVLAAEPYGTATFTDLGYRADLDVGVLTRTSGGNVVTWARGQGNVKVEYHAGRVDVPADVRLAALELIAHLWKSQRGATPSALQFATDTAPEQGFAPVYLIPNRVLELLAPHKKAPHV